MKEMLSEELLLQIKSHNDKGLYFEQYDPSPVIYRMYHDIRSLQSTIKVLESEAGIAALISSYDHRVNTLTEAFGSSVVCSALRHYYKQGLFESDEYFDLDTAMSKAEVLQSIKESPREEQGK